MAKLGTPPLGEVTVMEATGAGLPRQPFTKTGVQALTPVGSTSCNKVEGGQKVESTGTYWVESQEGPVWKYILPTEPLPGARSPENQIA